MTRLKNKILFALLFMTFTFAANAQEYVDLEENKEVETNREERNLIREGNDLFEEGSFAKAEVKYRQAISANPDSEIAQYNLAASLIKQSGKEDKLANTVSTIHKADSILKDFVRISKNQPLVSKAYYNLGNIAFNEEMYEPSVEMYKNCLRRNPLDDKARENLRLAQKRLQQQQDQQQEKKDDKQKEEQQEQKEQQDQQQNQQEQQQNQQQQQQKNEDKQNDKQEPQGASGQDNTEQILNAVQNNEKTTQQKVNAIRAKEEQQQRRRTKFQW